MSGFEPVVHTAFVEVDDKGDWFLTLESAGVSGVHLWNEAELAGGFPNASLSYQLIKRGYMPEAWFWTEAGERRWSMQYMVWVWV